ncbi:TM2 domain-containing protein [Paenibacillus arenosi]|uniref:TM2 domain-containing protein n=1 Tax=Paenibacillus arenosi TaxID=2774142 RepID=A0ABR9AWE4_9BACL|nr:TM2 domain-containing protein [Paenibacillus arenosi]MBD8498404.1 TM2 domain-containing protein [Paenibacillus arenosi]
MKILEWQQQLRSDQLIIFMQEYNNRRKSLKIAVLLWFFMGVYGGHRFYLGQPKKAVLLLLSSIILYLLPLWYVTDFSMGFESNDYSWDDEEQEATNRVLIMIGGLVCILIIWIVEGIRLKKKVASINAEIEQEVMNIIKRI